MLQSICEHIHNYFIHDRYPGTYTISGGAVSPTPAFKEGQRFLVVGSDLNDGIYTYHVDGLKDDDDMAGVGLADEIFTGALCGLSVPPQVIALAAEVNEWVGKYGDIINSPYQSESFGGYSYTRANGSDANGGNGTAGWREVFASRMNRWRKVSF